MNEAELILCSMLPGEEEGDLHCEEHRLREENRLLKEQVANLKKSQQNAERKYLPTLAELLDRLTITQIKEVKISEHKDKYAREIKEIIHDIEMILIKDQIWFTADMLRALIVLAQYNLHIWSNEANYRRGIKEGNDLELTHSLNGVRNRAKNLIQNALQGRQDYKIDCLAAEHAQWEPSWNEVN